MAESSLTDGSQDGGLFFGNKIINDDVETQEEKVVYFSQIASLVTNFHGLTPVAAIAYVCETDTISLMAAAVVNKAIASVKVKSETGHTIKKVRQVVVLQEPITENIMLENAEVSLLSSDFNSPLMAMKVLTSYDDKPIDFLPATQTAAQMSACLSKLSHEEREWRQLEELVSHVTEEDITNLDNLAVEHTALDTSCCSIDMLIQQETLPKPPPTILGVVSSSVMKVIDYFRGLSGEAQIAGNIAYQAISDSDFDTSDQAMLMENLDGIVDTSVLSRPQISAEAISKETTCVHY